jgi:transcriptional regulator with XRE-family HTH domain/DNA polymerase III delta prime subunit
MANQLLITARKQRGWTQAELSERVGANESSVVRWEKGTLPQPYYRQQLCALFELSEAELGFVRRHASVGVVRAQPAPEQVSPCDPQFPACPHLVGREADLSYLRQCLKDGDSFVLTGLPGVGKTALASALVREEGTQAVFGGILWASLGSEPDLFLHFARWGRSLCFSEQQIAHLDSVEKWQSALREAIGRRRFLLVIDDVWELTDLRCLSIGGTGCVSLVTTRNHRLAMESFHREYVVHELDLSQGFQLLQRIVPLTGDAESHRSEHLVRAVGGLPLALTIVSRYLRQQAYSGSLHRKRLRDALQHLEQAEVRFHLLLLPSSSGGDTDPSMSLFSQVQRSVRSLGEDACRALSTLAIFPPKPSSFSEEAACAVAGIAPEMLEELVDSGLVERAGASRYVLHPVIADYAGLHLDREAAGSLAARLIAYVVDFLETHICEDRILALESPMILAALETARAFGKLTELIYAVQLLAPFLWKMILPLNHALSQADGPQDASTASRLARAVAALADRLECSHEQDGLTPFLYGVALERLFHPPVCEQSDMSSQQEG